MTKAQLAEIRARAKAATSGPWVIGEGGDWIAFPGSGRDLVEMCSNRLDDYEIDPKNATFIAHSRKDIPALLDYIEELETKLALDGVDGPEAYGLPE